MAISIETPDEIEKMRVAGRLAAEVLEMIEPHVAAGVTTGDLDTIRHRHIVEERNAIPAPLDYGVPGTGERIEEGMTFTIEPMINAGRRHVKILPDGWTVITRDRRPSAQWEHTILVTRDGCEILTRPGRGAPDGSASA